MDEMNKPIIITNLFEKQKLLASRQWDVLRPGVWISKIYDDSVSGMSSAFLHYEAGATVPNHVHPGFEHILILHGSQEDGRCCYATGSLIIHPPGTQHNIASPEGCVALAIWQLPVEFT